MEKTVCIYCASSTRVKETYHSDAIRVTELLIDNGYAIKYGAGSVGLMGTVASTAIKKEGHITGVIPQFMVEMKWANNEVDELVVVKDMHERKRILMQDVEAVIALAGGIGTMDELIEVITLKQLGQFTKPIIILNTNNFYDHLIKQLDKMIDEGFLRNSHKDLWKVVSKPEDIITAILSIEDTSNSIIRLAQL